MPLVIVRRDKRVITDPILELVVAALPGIVSIALNVEGVPDASLAPKEIEVAVWEIGPFDLNAAPFSVIVFANNYPERQKNLKRRTEMIASGLYGLKNLADHLPDSIFTDESVASVWVRLSPAEFVYLSDVRK